MKMRFLTYLMLPFLLMATPLFAAEVDVPQQQIVGAEKPIPLGELVELSISPIQYPPKDLVSSSTEWRIIDVPTGVEKKVKASKDSVLFGSGIKNQKLIAFAAVTHLYVVKEADKVKSIETRTVIYRADVTLGDGTSPTPGPAPQPEVQLPEGKYNVSQKVYELAMRTVPQANRAKGAKALVSSFKGIASSVAAGVLTDPEDLLKKTATANTNALTSAGVSKDEWKAFFTEFMEISFKLYQDQTVVTARDFAACWNEVVVGLEAVK